MAEKQQSEKPEIIKPRKKPPRKKQNPIEVAISSWYKTHADQLKDKHNVSDLIAQAPKRWTAYGPLVLLPAGSFTTPAWRNVLASTAESSTVSLSEASNDEAKTERNGDLSGPQLLWKTILGEIAGSPKAALTHLAINEGIPLHSKDDSGDGEKAGAVDENENILRTPGGLRMLYGDFGPSALSTSCLEVAPTTAGNGVLRPVKVSRDDFARAFWVSTKQNGITQTWAPRWTMFSRGNIKEKARLLDFHNTGAAASAAADAQGGDRLSHRVVPLERRKRAVVVDLYAGIGYFAFCYAMLGFRVFCWELNPWSVEGLRRGAEANGWSVRVVIPPSSSRATSETDTQAQDGEEDKDEKEEEEEEVMLRDIVAGNETIVVFLEDNTRAAARIQKLEKLTRLQQHEEKEEIKREERRVGGGGGLRRRDIMHVNCGLLPSSEGSWEMAWDIASEAPQVWFHIHENVGGADIDARKEDIRRWFAKRAADARDAYDGSAETEAEAETETELCVEHVELVKTFAPGVWHCVFDLYLKRCLDKVDRRIT